jgi:hypothetical protein
MQTKGRKHEGSHMVKIAAIALTILTGCDFIAFGGQYTNAAMQVLTAIQHAFV